MATKIVPGEPGPSEFSWGKGIMAPQTEGYVPKVQDQLRALHRLNIDPTSVDATVELDYTDDTRES